MPISDDLRTLGDRASRELDAVHDYFEHSKLVWLSFQDFVDKGYIVQFTSLATGTAIDQAGLLGLGPHYTRAYLATFTFRQFVSTFEVFLFDFLHRLLLHNPWQFAKSALQLETVLNAGDREEIISIVLWKRLNDLRYENLREWFVTLNRAVKLDCPSEDEIDALAEMKAARDILEHNAGVVNDIYLRKAGKKARYTAGEYVEIDDSYHLASWQLIKKVVAAVSAAAIAKLSGP
jgi:hypothetical protein